MASDSYSVVAYGLAAFVVYITSLTVYRLYFCPLARFPGPKLAALTNWYEFYYDVIREGDFTWQIQKLHKKYGKIQSSISTVPIIRPTAAKAPLFETTNMLENTQGPIIRITPTELHIVDPDYFDTLYSRSPGRRNKSTYFASRFGHASDAFSTADHDLHRNRRKAIAPFFSAAKITQFEPTIRAKIDILCKRLDEYVENTGSAVILSRAWMALTTDIISEYAFGKSYGQLASEGFEDTLHEALVTAYVTGHFALHFPVVFPILDALPQWLVKLTKPEIMPVVGLRKVRSHCPTRSHPAQINVTGGSRCGGQQDPRRRKRRPQVSLTRNHLPRAPQQPRPPPRRDLRRQARRRGAAHHRRRPNHHLVGPQCGELPPHGKPCHRCEDEGGVKRGRGAV